MKVRIRHGSAPERQNQREASLPAALAAPYITDALVGGVGGLALQAAVDHPCNILAFNGSRPARSRVVAQILDAGAEIVLAPSGDGSQRSMDPADWRAGLGCREW